MPVRREAAVLDRRGFLQFAALSAGCLCAGAMGLAACASWREAAEIPRAPAGSYQREEHRLRVALSAFDEFATHGALRVALEPGEEGEEPLVILQLGAGDYRVFADGCTHKGKPLYYLAEEQALCCYSGKSRFDLEGSVLRGPAETALKRMPSWVEGDELVVFLRPAQPDRRSAWQGARR